MNPHRIYTRKTAGLDNRVWRLMIILIVLSAGMLGYSLVDKKKCTSFSFLVKSLGVHTNDVFYTGETLSFIASTPSGDISWNFGDYTGEVGATVHHTFLKEGIFLVTASSNSLCETERQITIKNPPVVAQPSGNVAGSIAGPTSCYTFIEQIFTWPGTAGSYEWSIPNHQSLGIKTGQTITYTFPYPGTYTIQVQLDNDRKKRYTLDVIVTEQPKVKPARIIADALPIPLPPIQEAKPQPGITPQTPVAHDSSAAEPTGPKKIYLADVIFLSYLKKVQDKEMAVADFDKYFCGGGGTPVIVNGNKKELKTFSWLCDEISGSKKKLIFFKKKIRIESAQLHRINGCVTIIDVNYK